MSYQAPTFASGEIGFYLAQIDPQTLSPIKVIQHNADALFPLASTFKAMTLWGALRDVDAGRLTLNQMYDVTLRNRSIEAYQPGPRTLLNLLQQMIKRSENTAADIVQGAVGAERLQQLVTSQGSCNTTVRISTKAWWAAQGGLLPDVFGTSLPTGAAAYFAAPDADQAQTAAQAIQSAMNFTPSQVDDNLNRYFSSSLYSPQLDVQLQNHSTAREWAALIARLYLKNGLSDSSQTLLRTIMSSGCCTKPGPQYWGSKAGSGWRLLTMSGLLQVNGSFYVYSYLNHGSDIMDTDHLEGQLPQVSAYILSSIQRLQPRP
ncbi:hypothetical protein GCM10008957_23320 [Deinococcus ruber]|uniref:Beta-lactamase class A catalytic domain-containing protein n=1 Tax=Deinococcus ruber TaxID=1848197 RepID=A0A918C6X1_9DEIO|nr:hypothetical protein GCM10008957_23320 [Deinococcus ruber]